MVKSNNIKEKKGGRPKGAKSNFNLPARGISDAVEWTRKIHEKAKEKEFSPEDLTSYLDIGKGFASPAISVLDKFGFIEKASYGWKISELGKSAIRGDKDSLKQALERIELFRELIKSFGDREVTKSIIVNYLKSKYKKENNEAVAERFAESIDFLNSFGQLDVKSEEKGFAVKEACFSDEDLQIILKMKYAFQPIKEELKETILEEAYNKFKDYGDSTIESLIEEIKKNKKNEAVRNALINAFVSSFEKKYPILKDSVKEKKKEESLE